LITASKLAGFFAAHAIWCVSDANDALIPMLAYTQEDDSRQMIRLAHEDTAAAVEEGKRKLAANDMDAVDAVLVYDGRITLDDGKCDAIILKLRASFSPDSEAVIAIPYTPKSSGKFRVHKPKLLAWEHCDDFDTDVAFEEFFAGVDEHEKGAQVWNAALDESKLDESK
jgi:hypothetical protein